ncbi:MAG TPA: cysteine--tRNA ligase [Candidatus Omnitrophota bacterium]|nr:cysteine--tRNA ligase [Candidatus Omnitrophota bacterium]
MHIQIHNSLSNKKEILVPIQDKRVSMYACGVTVYDRCHIGHARSLYIFDVIRRYLMFRGYNVRFIRNITDIDDKIINRAQELKKDWRIVVDDNIQAYREDLRALGILDADAEPRATENIPEMIKHIEGLIEKGFAYPQDGDVYFSVRQFKDYGKLSGQSIEKMQEAVRIEKDDKKKDPLDFALWKRSKEGEPFWESPWGKGRPGWHIECSAMSMKYAQAETLDIHAGGRDLVFPHHENEVAQSEALTGKPFARCWIHHGLLTINGQKMSKSLKNFITVSDALSRYGVDALKLFFLSSHYASPLDFTEEKMIDMRKNLERFSIFFAEARTVQPSGALIDPAIKAFDQHYQEFIKAMDDDFNTPRALAALFEMVSETYKLKSQKEYPSIVKKVAQELQGILRDIFGIVFITKEVDLTEEEGSLIKEREIARHQKDFKRSDELRDALKARGIIVEDGKEGQKWRRG